MATLLRCKGPSSRCLSMDVMSFSHIAARPEFDISISAKPVRAARFFTAISVPPLTGKHQRVNPEQDRGSQDRYDPTLPVVAGQGEWIVGGSPDHGV